MKALVEIDGSVFDEEEKEIFFLFPEARIFGAFFRFLHVSRRHFLEIGVIVVIVVVFDEVLGVVFVVVPLCSDGGDGRGSGDAGSYCSCRRGDR